MQRERLGNLNSQPMPSLAIGVTFKESLLTLAIAGLAAASFPPGAGVLAGVIACTDSGSVAGMAFIIGASAAGVLAGAIDCADGDSAGFPEISAAAVCAGSGGGVACTNARTEL